MINIPTPKLNRQEQLNGVLLYPYYAGFSHEFVYSVLKGRAKTDIVLDTWAGTGSTNIIASQLGLNSYGFDINPVMIVVAKANSISYETAQSINALCCNILSHFKSRKSFGSSSENDPLSLWLDSQTITSFRRLEQVVFNLLVDGQGRESQDVDVQKLSDIASFFYIAIFKTLKFFLKSNFSSSNPTWIKTAKKDTDKIGIDKKAILATFQAEVEKQLSILEAKGNVVPSQSKLTLQVGDSQKVELADESIDFTLTSPPYCTRIDYAVSTRPELAILGKGGQIQFRNIRESIIGSTAIKKSDIEPQMEWGKSCLNFLADMRKHSSRASKTYYYKNHLQYFESMYSSFKEIQRTTKKNGELGLVIQDSYYKELHNDLPVFFNEMLGEIGFRLINKQEFKTNSLNNINRKSSKYHKGKSKPKEFYLHFVKENRA